MKNGVEELDVVCSITLLSLTATLVTMGGEMNLSGCTVGSILLKPPLVKRVIWKYVV